MLIMVKLEAFSSDSFNSIILSTLILKASILSSTSTSDSLAFSKSFSRASRVLITALLEKSKKSATSEIIELSLS